MSTTLASPVLLLLNLLGQAKSQPELYLLTNLLALQPKDLHLMSDFQLTEQTHLATQMMESLDTPITIQHISPYANNQSSTCAHILIPVCIGKEAILLVHHMGWQGKPSLVLEAFASSVHQLPDRHQGWVLPQG
ncbi:unnamed protein product [Sphagnum tenellum]